MRDRARRLPQLVRRSLPLAWRVDRRVTVGLLLCQLVTGEMQALGLVAIAGTLTALLRDGDASAGQPPPIGRSRPLGRAVTVRAWTS